MISVYQLVPTSTHMEKLRNEMMMDIIGSSLDFVNFVYFNPEIEARVKDVFRDLCPGANVQCEVEDGNNLTINIAMPLSVDNIVITIG